MEGEKSTFQFMVMKLKWLHWASHYLHKEACLSKTGIPSGLYVKSFDVTNYFPVSKNLTIQGFAYIIAHYFAEFNRAHTHTHTSIFE